MGVTDVFLVMPMLPLAILVAVYLGPSIWNLILVIGLLWWPSTARVIRSQVLSIRESGYVESARALGAGDLWIMWRHVLPNVLPLLMAKFVLTVAMAMLMDASLELPGPGRSDRQELGHDAALCLPAWRIRPRAVVVVRSARSGHRSVHTCL